MDESLLEIRDYQGEGYKPLVDYGEWRVAILRYLDGLHPERIDSMERHTETDEVFVLLSGQAILILGGRGEQLEETYSQCMEIGKVYNVKRSVWHTILLSSDASVLIVENRDTGGHNSEYAKISAENRLSIRKIAQEENLWIKEGVETASPVD
jgi:ureidoglycolate hydrolase